LSPYPIGNQINPAFGTINVGENKKGIFTKQNIGTAHNTATESAISSKIRIQPKKQGQLIIIELSFFLSNLVHWMKKCSFAALTNYILK